MRVRWGERTKKNLQIALATSSCYQSSSAPGTDPIRQSLGPFQCQATSRFLTHPRNFKDESEWEQSKFYLGGEKERGQSASATVNEAKSTCPSGHGPTHQWVAHVVSYFLELYVFPRRSCLQALWHQILTLSSHWGREGDCLVANIIRLESGMAFVLLSPASACGVDFHFNEGIMSFRVILWSIVFSILDCSGSNWFLLSVSLTMVI